MTSPPTLAFLNPLLADTEDFVVEAGKLFKVRPDDLRLYHEIAVDTELGKAFFQAGPCRRPAELFGKKFHTPIWRQRPIDQQSRGVRMGRVFGEKQVSGIR